MNDLIDRAEAIRIASGYCHPANIAEELRKLPAAVPEPLTDAEQRIFLAAMSREEKIYRQTDEELKGPVNLVRICREIERKVKGALWGT